MRNNNTSIRIGKRGKRSLIIILRLLVLLLFAVVVADDDNYYATDDYNNDDDNQNNNDNTLYQYSQYNPLQVCDDSVVQVQEIYYQCDSPYTFYYGNGANRNSPVCDYGDKLSLVVQFVVTDSIQETDEIYVTMAVYDGNGDLLTSTSPDYLCANLVQSSCTSAGQYEFQTKLKLGYPSTSSSSSSSYDDDDYYNNNNNNNNNDNNYQSDSNFYAVMEMAFSTAADSGYNLGAVNTECQRWDADGEPGYVQWSTATKPKSAALEFLSEYGMLLGTAALFVAFCCWVWHQAKIVLTLPQSLGQCHHGSCVGGGGGIGGPSIGGVRGSSSTIAVTASATTTATTTRQQQQQQIMQPQQQDFTSRLMD